MYLTKLRHALLATTIASALLASGCASGAGDDDAGSGTGAATAATTPASLSREYQGTIKDLKIMVRLDVQGSNVSGSYFYADKTGNGDVITLKGTIAGNQLKLDESVKGQKTGQMAATVSGTKISGTWAKPDGTGKLTLTLDAIPTTKLLPVTRKLAQSFKATEGTSAGFDTCALTSSYIEVYGMADAKTEAAINGILATKPIDSSCDFPSSETFTQEVKLNDKGLLVIVQSEEDDGGAHPNEGHTAFNFDVATGKQLAAKDIFKSDALPKLKELVLATVPPDQKDDVTQQLDEMSIDGYDTAVMADGVQIDFVNEFPHVILAEAPLATLKWADVKDLLQPGTAVAKLAQ